MDWLTRLPWIGPRIAAVLRTHAWRAFAHLQSVHWTRLAAAMTFTSFLSLFPLLAVSAVVGTALLSQSQLDALERNISEQFPGIADQLDISGLVANAGTVGVIAGAALVFTGLSWIGSLRDCLRAVWGKDDSGENPVVGKLVDARILVGLGVAVLVSLGASGFATAAVHWTADKTGISDHGIGGGLLTAVGFVIAVVADFLILTYLLTLLPGVEPPRRSVVLASLIGAVGFELLKILISSYLQQVAAKTVYGAFGTPVALLLWLNFVARLLLYCAAWTATPRHAPEPAESEPAESEPAESGPGERESGGPEGAGSDSADPEAGGPEATGPGTAGPAKGPAPGPEATSADDRGRANGNGNGKVTGGGSHRWDRTQTEAEADGGAARR